MPRINMRVIWQLWAIAGHVGNDGTHTSSTVRPIFHALYFAILLFRGFEAQIFPPDPFQTLQFLISFRYI